MSRSLFGVLFITLAIGTGCASVPNVPAGPPAEIHLAPEKASNKYHVRMIDAAGKASDCETPCTLQVASGTGELDIQGSGKFKQRIVVPEGASDAQIEQMNKITYNTGYGLTVAALVLLFYMVIFVKDTDTTIILASTGLVLSGSALVLLLVSGKNDITLTPGKASAPAPPPPPPPPPPPTEQPAQSIFSPSINRGLTIGWAF